MNTSCRSELLTNPNYTFSSVAKYIGETPQHMPMARVSLTEIEESIANFTRRVDGIMIPADGIHYTLKGLKYPIERIKEYIDSPNTSGLTAKDVCIFVDYTLGQYNELIVMADALDAEINME
jgi:hypothetical protein